MASQLPLGPQRPAPQRHSDQGLPGLGGSSQAPVGALRPQFSISGSHSTFSYRANSGAVRPHAQHLAA